MSILRAPFFHLFSLAAHFCREDRHDFAAPKPTVAFTGFGLVKNAMASLIEVI